MTNKEKLRQKRALRYLRKRWKGQGYIPTEFGILDAIEPETEYPLFSAGNCVMINDNAYMNHWYSTLEELGMATFYNSLRNPGISLNRWGVTLIPPESIPMLLDIVISDPGFGADPQLSQLAALLKRAISENKFAIHYGV